MPLLTLKTRLVREVLSTSNNDVFRDAQSRQTALAAHDHISSVLGSLGSASSSMHERDELVRALLYEYQRTGRPLWSGALTLAFLPLLHTLLARTVGDDLPAEDLDQIVSASFLEVVASFPLPKFVGQTVIELKRRTWKRIVAQLKAERHERDLVDVMDPEDLLSLDPSIWPVTDRRRRSRFDDNDEDGVLKDLLVELAGAVLSRADIDLLAATNLRGRRLSIYVAALYADATQTERTRAYARLKRARSRAIAKLRPLVDGLCCPHSEG